MKKKILYLQSYNTRPLDKEFNMFCKYMPQQSWELIAMPYDILDCQGSLARMQQTIHDEDIHHVIGIGLGGFLAMFAKGVERKLINPYTTPSQELVHLAKHNRLPEPSADVLAAYAALEQKAADILEEDRQSARVYQTDRCDTINAFTSSWVLPGGPTLSAMAVKHICYLYTDKYLRLHAAHKASFKNGEAIRASETCGCYCCRKIFPASETVLASEYDGQQTGWCPYCDTDSVLGDTQGYPITDDFLAEMQEQWFFSFYR